MCSMSIPHRENTFKNFSLTHGLWSCDSVADLSWEDWSLWQLWNNWWPHHIEESLSCTRIIVSGLGASPCFGKSSFSASSCPLFLHSHTGTLNPWSAGLYHLSSCCPFREAHAQHVEVLFRIVDSAAFSAIDDYCILLSFNISLKFKPCVFLIICLLSNKQLFINMII